MPVIVLAILLQSVFDGGLRDGLLALNRGDLVSARALLESASNQQPGNAVVWAALAQVYLKSDRKEAALEAARRAEQLEPDNPAIEHALAMFYTGAGDPGKAAGFERRFAATPQSDDEALFRAAKLYLQAGNPASAIETAQAAIARKDRPALHHFLGQAYDAEKQPARAVEEFRAAVRLAPGDEEFSFDLAQALFRSEGFAEAAAVLETSAKAHPASPQIRLALGVAYYGLRRFPEAINAFLKTIGLSPDTEQPYVFLSKMLDQPGDSLPEIQSHFEQFRRRHPDGYLGSFLVAKALMQDGGTPDQVEPLLRDAIRKNGAIWELHADLADLLSRRRDYSGAAAELEISAKLNPSEPSIPFRLARVYDRLNQSEKASRQRARHEELLAMPRTGMGQEKP
ncbi:MAG: tetratricopeptide repeat protein [Acidobacteriota bacterium]|nr:tetratricopeptide repeat protein [Acidobacteriota bacterium]